jgi:hypothetical protein
MFPVNQIVSNGVERIACNIDKVELFLHARLHSF